MAQKNLICKKHSICELWTYGPLSAKSQTMLAMNSASSRRRRTIGNNNCQATRAGHGGFYENQLRDQNGGFPKLAMACPWAIRAFTHAECTLVRAGCG